VEAHDNAELDGLDYFEALHAGFQRALRNCSGVIERFYSIGGCPVCIRFAGDALVPLLSPALSHLAIEPTSSPALTICVWDSASTQTQLPLLLGSYVDTLRQRWAQLLGRRREITQIDGKRIRASFFFGADILSALDTRRNLAVYWIERPERVPYWERGSPFLSILSWAMESVNRHYVHAGAVGNRSGGVLLAGKGGSGKSTTALSCVSSELLYASDDYCLVEGDPDPYVYSLYNTAKLKGLSDFERFPHLSEKTTNIDRLEEEKALIFLHRHYPEKIVSGFPIRAVVVPRVTGGPQTRIKPASAMEAFKALAPSSFFQLPGAGQLKLQMLGKLVKRVPCFSLELGSDIQAIAPAIARVLTYA